MNCEECEKLIYLQEELSDPEQHNLTTHLVSCSSCRQLLEEVQHDKVLVGLAKQFSVSPLDSGRLTGKVMSGVFPENASQGGSTLPWLRWIRYGFALFCVCVVLFFYAEWTDYETGMPDSTYVSSPKEASLISPSVRELRSRDSDVKKSVYHLLKQNNSK